MRAFAYHIHGHLAAAEPARFDEQGQEHTTLPFDYVLRTAHPITSDQEMEFVRHEVRRVAQAEIDKAMDQAITVKDALVRGVSLLHTLEVEGDDPDGPVKEVLS